MGATFSQESPSLPTASSSPPPKKDKPVSWTSTLNSTDWSHYRDPRNFLPILLLTGTCLASYSFYRSYLRRLPTAALIPPPFYRKRSIFGRVTSVGDGDNFRLFHTPGGRLAGWGWLPWRQIPSDKKALKDNTVHVRLAGVDAPELPHFGREGQPGGKEAIDWLTAYILGRRVRAYVYRRDQYDRVVATVYVRKGLLRRDVGLQMLKRGLATVYEAKTGAEFGALEDRYRSIEALARGKKVGIWGGKNFESPREFKSRTKDEGDAAPKEGGKSGSGRKGSWLGGLLGGRKG